MPRHRPPDRFAALLSTATRLFVRAGVRRVQVDEIARAAGVAKGTVYLYVESKEALFDLALRLADGPPPATPEVLPIRTPAPGATLAFVRDQARLRGAFPALSAAVGRPRRREVDVVLAELYDGLAASATLLKLVAGSAVDWPELGEVWFGETRGRLLARLAAWIEDRAARGTMRAGLHPAATARLVAETTTWFAVHRRWDPHPEGLPDGIARSTALAAVRRALEP